MLPCSLREQGGVSLRFARCSLCVAVIRGKVPTLTTGPEPAPVFAQERGAPRRRPPGAVSDGLQIRARCGTLGDGREMRVVRAKEGSRQYRRSGARAGSEREFASGTELARLREHLCGRGRVLDSDADGLVERDLLG